MIETGTFFRKCPCCASEIEIKLSPEKDDITISGTKIETGEVRNTPPPPYAQAQLNIDRKCAYCFRNAIRGGVLCQSHSFCRGCEKPFPDGKPFEIKEFPMCDKCSEAK